MNKPVIQQQPMSITQMIQSDSFKKQLMLAAPKYFNVDRVARIMVTAFRKNPKLTQCSQASLMGALMTTTELGLEPNTVLGHAYLIPYRTECQFQLGYQGLLELAYRSGKYSYIDACAVYEGDEFDFEFGSNRHLRHKPIGKHDSDPIYYYAIYQMKDDDKPVFKVWTREQVEHHRDQYSEGYGYAKKKGKTSNPWQTNFNAMAKKTVLKDVLKYAPKSIEVVSAMANDGEVLNGSLKDGQFIFEEPGKPEAIEPHKVDEATKVEQPTAEELDALVN